MAIKFEFIDSTDIIKDQLLSGWLDNNIREAFFPINNLKLEIALKTPLACEEANTTANKIKLESEKVENKQEVLRLNNTQKNRAYNNKTNRIKTKEDSKLEIIRILNIREEYSKC